MNRREIHNTSERPQFTVSDPRLTPAEFRNDHPVDLLDRAEEDFVGNNIPPFAIQTGKGDGVTETRTVANSTEDGSRPNRPTKATLVRRHWDDGHACYTLDINTRRIIVKCKSSGYYRWIGGSDFETLAIAHTWQQNGTGAYKGTKRKRQSEPASQSTGCKQRLKLMSEQEALDRIRQKMSRANGSKSKQSETNTRQPKSLPCSPSLLSPPISAPEANPRHRQ